MSQPGGLCAVASDGNVSDWVASAGGQRGLMIVNPVMEAVNFCRRPLYCIREAVG